MPIERGVTPVLSDLLHLLMSPMALITERVELACNGANDKVICRMASGWAVMGRCNSYQVFACCSPTLSSQA
ncbi:hypothetical protein D9M69_415750 [compost metagenome]